MKNLTSFKIKIGNQEYDYRLGKKLNLKEVASFFARKYKVRKIWLGTRHVLGILEKQNQRYFLKLATSPGISVLTENEFRWNENFNKEVKRSQSSFWVPENYDSGYYKKLFYLITDYFDGKTLENELDQLEIFKILEFVKIIGNLKNVSSTGENYQDYFLRKTRLWYENIPIKIAAQYEIEKLLKMVEQGTNQLIQKPRHGDFTPWHLLVLSNGKLGLIDGEHAMGNGVEGYDLAYFIQRVFSVSKNPELAKRILEKALGENFSLEKLKTVLAARAIGGFLDESLAPKPNYQFAQEFQSWVIGL